jgi:hypothetical protein
MNNADPKWWSTEHTSVWERIKGALRRDWEQTKADLSSGGKELNQGVTDTVKQAVGADPLPGPNQATPDDDDWKTSEPGYRYGAGASHQYAKDEPDWNDRVEAKLKEEWADLRSGKTWDEAKSAVRRGWDRARSKVV